MMFRKLKRWWKGIEHLERNLRVPNEEDYQKFYKEIHWLHERLKKLESIVRGLQSNKNIKGRAKK